MEKRRNPGTLNIGRINLSKNLCSIGIILVYCNSSVAIKKGRREGTILLTHNRRPFFAADILLVENSNNPSTKSASISESKLFSFNIKILLFFIFIL